MYNNTENKSSYIGFDIPISSANINKTGWMLLDRAKYTARTSIAVINTANSNLDGTGTISVLISPSGYGTLVTRIIIKAQGNTTQGMVRVFLSDASSTNRLLREVEIPAVIQASDQQTLIKIIDDFFYLKNNVNMKLKVSTEKAETFIVTAEGFDLSYPA